MTWLEFIVGMTSALAWPLALIILILIFQKPLKKLIGRIKTMKYGDTEVGFAAEIEEVNEVAIRAEVTIFQPLSKIPDATQALLSTDPRAAVLSGWLPLQDELRKLVEQGGQKWTGVRSATAALHRKNLLRDEEWAVIQKLSQMRNIAAHDLENSITKEDATRFLQIAKSMEERIAQSSQRLS